MSKDLYDLNVLERIVNGDKEFMRQMVRMFIDKIPNDVKRLKDAKATQNWEEIGQVAHKIKSSIKMMGIHSLLDKIIDIELKSKAGKELDKIPQKLDEFFLILEEVLIQLDKEKI